MTKRPASKFQSKGDDYFTEVRVDTCVITDTGESIRNRNEREDVSVPFRDHNQSV